MNIAADASAVSTRIRYPSSMSSRGNPASRRLFWNAVSFGVAKPSVSTCALPLWTVAKSRRSFFPWTTMACSKQHQMRLKGVALLSSTTSTPSQSCMALKNAEAFGSAGISEAKLCWLLAYAQTQYASVCFNLIVGLAVFFVPVYQIPVRIRRRV